MRKFLATLVIVAAVGMTVPNASHAQSLKDVLVSQLIEQGYDEITSRRTLLGRIRITAENEEFYREIVINPSTGVILRDYLRRKSYDGDQVRFHDPYDDEEGGSQGSGGSEDGGHDDDDDDDDDEDDDDDDEDDDDDDDDD